MELGTPRPPATRNKRCLRPENSVAPRSARDFNRARRMNVFSKFETELAVRPDDIALYQHVHSTRYLDYVLEIGRAHV